jgi:hypothetical protein
MHGIHKRVKILIAVHSNLGIERNTVNKSTYCNSLVFVVEVDGHSQRCKRRQGFNSPMCRSRRPISQQSLGGDEMN